MYLTPVFRSHAVKWEGDTERPASSGYRNCGCEPETGKLDSYLVDNKLSPIIKSINYWSRYTWVRLPIRYPEQLYRE